MTKLLIVGDPSGFHTDFAISKRNVNPEDIVVFDPEESHVFLASKPDPRVTVTTDIEVLETMLTQFTNSIINPPYQAPGLKNTGKTIWDKFIPIVFDKVVDGGYMSHVHPASWRKPFHHLNWMLKYQFHKLSIHNDSEGMKVFNAGTRFDYYLLEKTPAYKTSLVRFEGESDYQEVDLRGRDFLPNFELELWDLVSFFSADKKAPKDLYMSAQRSGHINPESKHICDTPTEYQIMHKLSASGKSTVVYSAIPHPINQFNKKVMFSESRYILAIYDGGTMGCSGHMTWIDVDSVEEGNVIVHFINSEIGKRLVKSSKWGNFRTEQVMWSKIINPFKIGVTVDDTDDQILNKYQDYRNKILK